ncbi:MAG: ectoine synthase [Alphaproteobacteria bacterium]
MFVRTVDELRNTGRESVLGDGKARSARLLTKVDGMGFSLSDATLSAGAEVALWYKNHWEANYIVSGHGAVTDVASGESRPLAEGALYTVGPKDRHLLAATTDLRIISIFNPPLVGDETHDEDGAYPPTGPLPPGRPRMFVKTVEELRAAGREKVVAGGSARSVRMLLEEDGVGVTIADVNLAAGNENVLWYKHHWEANYMLAGSGEVCDLTTGESWPLEPGTMYCVGPPDRHSMHAHTDLHLVSVFCPALKGDEMHDGEGTLAPSGPIPPGPKTV